MDAGSAILEILQSIFVHPFSRMHTISHLRMRENWPSNFFARFTKFPVTYSYDLLRAISFQEVDRCTISHCSRSSGAWEGAGGSWCALKSSLSSATVRWRKWCGDGQPHRRSWTLGSHWPGRRGGRERRSGRPLGGRRRKKKLRTLK